MSDTLNLTPAVIDRMVKNFRKRKAENAKKEQINNARLPAGSPMYFYCRYCGDSTAVLPEGYTCKPRTVCVPCEGLEQLGEMPPRP
jgi:hypothetical protein